MSIDNAERILDPYFIVFVMIDFSLSGGRVD